MPPKRKSAANNSDSDEPKPKKAAKTPKAPLTPLDPDLPINKTFPPSLEILKKADGVTRLATWNVCGIKACDKKGLKFYLEAEDPDLIVLTETKVQTEPDIMYLKTRYKHRYWGADPQKGYAGVAVLSKIKPLNVIYGLPTWSDQAASAGRLVTLEFPKYFLIGTYVPNAGDKLKNMEIKKKWNTAFGEQLRIWDKAKPCIWLGDINCAQTDKDIRHAKNNWNKSPGYTQDEIDGLLSQLNPKEGEGEKLIDVWRARNPDKVGHYTYYSYKFGCREKGIGWRLDTAILSERIVDQVEICEIRHEVYGASDHVPLMIDIKGDL